MLSTLRNTLLRNRSAFTQARALNLANARRAFFSQGPKPEEPAAQQTATNTQANQATQEIKPEQVQQAKVADKAEEKPGFIDSISKKVPIFGKVADFVVDSIRETFPSDQYMAKAEQAKKEAKLMNEKQQEKKEYTEEELNELQENIPEWKRTSMVEFADESAEQPSLKAKMSNKIKEKFNETEFARYLYKSEQYKEYEDFKKEMSQFKEDYKDHLSQSQNPALIASMAIYGKVTTESNTSQAIKEMRKYTRGFDIFDLERDARGIFCDVFNAYLKGDLTYIEKTCEDAGLAFFKTMLKKREVDGVFPKYTEVWESEPADLVGGRISERNMPSFTFSVRIQEIHCNISKKTNKVVDGTDDNLLQRRFNIVLSPHENPDIETVGHKWSIVEVLPVEATPMLA